MQKETISPIGFFSILLIILTGGTILLNFPLQGGHDTWIGIIIGALIILPFVLIYIRLIHLMPAKNIFQMAETVFGKFFSKLFCICFIFYYAATTSVIAFDFPYFVNMTSLVHTKHIVLVSLFLFAAFFLANAGPSVLSGWCMVFVVISLILMLFTSAISQSKIDYNNLRPILYNSPKSIFESAVRMSALPFGEIIFSLGIADSLRSNGKTRRIYLGALAIGCVYLVITFIRICCTLGAEAMKITIFQNYKSISVLKISNFFDRIETFVTYIYILAGIALAAVAIIAACNGLKQLFRLPSYRTLLIPLVLLIFAWSIQTFDGILQTLDFMKRYVFYAFPFQTILPLILWIRAELHVKKHGREHSIAEIEEEIELLEEEEFQLTNES